MVVTSVIFAQARKTEDGQPIPAFPDVCWVPKDPELRGVPIPYPNGTLISVSKEKSAGKVYSVKSGKATELPIRDVANAPTFIVLDDGSVSVHEHECRTPDAAKRAVVGDIDANASATVISIGEEEKSPLAFRVTSSSVYSLRVETKSDSQENTGRE